MSSECRAPPSTGTSARRGTPAICGGRGQERRREMSRLELISRTTRGLFRDLMTSSTVGRIGAAFQDEGFAPSSDCTYDDSSVRRILTQQYLEAVDWTDINHIDRVLRVFERLTAWCAIRARGCWPGGLADCVFPVC